jgi:hypothetical protein
LTQTISPTQCKSDGTGAAVAIGAPDICEAVVAIAAAAVGDALDVEDDDEPPQPAAASATATTNMPRREVKLIITMQRSFD